MSMKNLSTATSKKRRCIAAHLRFLARSIQGALRWITHSLTLAGMGHPQDYHPGLESSPLTFNPSLDLGARGMDWSQDFVDKSKKLVVTVFRDAR